MAEDHGVTLALEAHVGQEFDSPEKAVWPVEAVGRPSVRLNFGHSHFHVLGMGLQHCVDLCAPYAVHTHLQDGRMAEGGRVQFLLPGDGDLDLQAYFRAVSGAGIDVLAAPGLRPVGDGGEVLQGDDERDGESAATGRLNVERRITVGDVGTHS